MEKSSYKSMKQWCYSKLEMKSQKSFEELFVNIELHCFQIKKLSTK